MTSWIVTISGHLKTQEMCNEAVRTEPLSLPYIPDRFKTQEMCNEAVRNRLCIMLFVRGHLWMQEMCNEIMRTMPNAFHRIPDHFKTQKMCIKAVEVDSSFLQLVPDHFKTQQICEKAVREDSSSLQYVPDWFVTREELHMWHDDYCDDDNGHWDDDDDKFFEWYDSYKKQNAQKARIKKQLMRVAWHPSRWWNWCFPEDEKKETVKLWAWAFFVSGDQIQFFFGLKEL